MKKPVKLNDVVAKAAERLEGLLAPLYDQHGGRDEPIYSRASHALTSLREEIQDLFKDLVWGTMIEVATQALNGEGQKTEEPPAPDAPDAVPQGSDMALAGHHARKLARELDTLIPFQREMTLVSECLEDIFGEEQWPRCADRLIHYGYLRAHWAVPKGLCFQTTTRLDALRAGAS